MSGVINYTRVNFKDFPDKTTPITAANLNKLDKGVYDLDLALKNTNDLLGTASQASGVTGATAFAKINKINNDLADLVDTYLLHDALNMPVYGKAEKIGHSVTIYLESFVNAINPNEWVELGTLPNGLIKEYKESVVFNYRKFDIEITNVGLFKIRCNETTLPATAIGIYGGISYVI